MTSLKPLAAFALVLIFGAAIAEDAPDSWDGLVAVKPRKLDAVYLLPGADFRPYTKIKVDPTEVAFNKNWMKSQNNQRDLSRRVTDEDAQKILAAVQTNFDDIFVEAFQKAGYTVVTAPGPDVLRVYTGVVNLYVNAPDIQSAGRSRTFTTEVGEATLVIETRDSVTGALLARVLDRRNTRSSPGMRMTTSVSNVSDFRILFTQWAGISVQGLEELKAISPVPTDLQPKQKL